MGFNSRFKRLKSFRYEVQQSDLKELFAENSRQLDEMRTISQETVGLFQTTRPTCSHWLGNTFAKDVSAHAVGSTLQQYTTGQV